MKSKLSLYRGRVAHTAVRVGEGTGLFPDQLPAKAHLVASPAAHPTLPEKSCFLQTRLEMGPLFSNWGAAGCLYIQLPEGYTHTQGCVCTHLSVSNHPCVFLLLLKEVKFCRYILCFFRLKKFSKWRVHKNSYRSKKANEKQANKNIWNSRLNRWTVE